MNSEQKAAPIAVLVCFFIVAICAYYLSPNRSYEVKPKPPKPPFNWTNAGEKVGQNTGRTVRGFFKGLWKSGDNK